MSDEPEVITYLRFLHDGKVDWLTTECTTTGVTISDILVAYDTLRARLAAAARVVEAAEQFCSYQGTATEPEKYAALSAALDTYIAAIDTQTTTEDA